jgi:hypothetical protein
MALIDHRDAADAGLRVLTDPALWGAHHDLTGPAPMSWPEALELLSAELGEPVTFRVEAERQFLARLTGAGVSAGEAELLITREWAILAGGAQAPPLSRRGKRARSDPPSGAVALDDQRQRAVRVEPGAGGAAALRSEQSPGAGDGHLERQTAGSPLQAKRRVDRDHRRAAGVALAVGADVRDGLPELAQQRFRPPERFLVAAGHDRLAARATAYTAEMTLTSSDDR